MRSFLRRPSAAVPLLALGVVFALPGVAGACGDGKPDGRKFEPDGFTLTAETALIEEGDGVPTAGACPAPACSTTICATVNPSTPFQRPSAYEAAPISPHAGCFGIAKRDANFYIQLTLDGPGKGFHRNVSTDGGFSWTAGPVVLAADTLWWRGIKCPDLQYLPSGNLLLYFRAAGAGGTPTGIARGVSTDDGLTWTVDPGPVLTSPVPGFTVDNPSVLRRSATLWVMAYTLVCTGPGITGPFQLAETWLASSSDGIIWTHSPHNPAIVPGACGAWDQGAIANPVLLADPVTSSKLHLFYTGANWNGKTTRGCAKIGHAISTNNGRTWCKTGVVLDHPPSGAAWDDIQYMVSSYTVEPNNTIRMYYWGQGTSVLGGLGIAEASWPLTAGCAPLHEEPRWSVDSSTSPTLPLPGTGDLSAAGVQLRAHPNPTTGGVTILHALQDRGLAGTGSISIIDIQGRQIAHVWRGELSQAPSQFEWNGRDDSGARVAAGRYFIRLESRGDVVAAGWVTVTP